MPYFALLLWLATQFALFSYDWLLSRRRPRPVWFFPGAVGFLLLQIIAIAWYEFAIVLGATLLVVPLEVWALGMICWLGGGFHAALTLRAHHVSSEDGGPAHAPHR